MARSRSSFDLEGAIASAEALSPQARDRAATRDGATTESQDPSSPFAGVSLISFGGDKPVDEGPPSSPDGPITSRAPQVGELDDAAAGERRNPPKLPDLSAMTSVEQRCERIAIWIAEATGASDVFLADAEGLPLAGAVRDAEARLAGSGLVASAVGTLASAIPGSASPLFEMHIGEGPFFQLIGFQVGSTMYVVGLTRRTPLSARQAHAVRLACRHALGDLPRSEA